MTAHTILGRDVQMPVQIRLANAFMATYTVPAAAAQAVIDYSGLEVLRVRPGRALCTLVFVNYIDGDLGPYNEFGVSFMVRHDGSSSRSTLGDLRALATGGAGVLIHRLPVDGEFTLAAGRGIWGFPKELADFDVDHDSDIRRGTLHKDGQLVVDLTVQRGIAMPGSGRGTSFDAYSHLDGVTRCTPWQMNPSGVRSRLGGAKLQLGEHPWARELAELGLPKRAVMTSTIPNLQMTFQDSRVLRTS